ncbi:Acetyl esterase/lipase [Spirosomataceae bacterium TFI 002]|nr:Acetyl esterase/lipase [Spirosomataceae bacterium TFI 002]
MKKNFFFLLLLGMMSQVNGQELIKLYPGDAPGLKQSAKNTKEERTVDANGIMRIRSVTVPDLKVVKPKIKNETGASVIICPGGGYHILAYNHEGDTIADWFASHGVTAFILKYRLPQPELFDQKEIRPLEDVQQAIRLVRTNAAKYGVDPNKIGVMGFSAGGHLAASAATKFNDQVGELANPKISVRPDYSILLYPVISFSDKYAHTGSRHNLIGPDLELDQIDKYSNELNVTKDTPPTFLVHAFDDGVKIENSFIYARALKNNGVPVEFHAYEKGGHGFGMTKKGRGPVESWPDRLADWLKNNDWMK